MKHLVRLDRRSFLRTSTAALATISFVPGHVLGLNGAEPPGEKLNLACIGVSGRGGANLKELSSQNIVALCDVDNRRLAQAGKNHPKAARHRDYRKMLDAVGKEIDAVVVSTPDHTHAVAAMRVIRMKKHLYCEKPLAHSIGEVRALVAAARKYKVVTQLGNQGHSSDTIRRFCEWVWAGAVGRVRELHGWCQSAYSRMGQLPALKETPPVPEALAWDLWLGPAQYRPYHPMYLPGMWRAWFPFGTGVIGDWTCHVIDPVFWAYDLGAPTSVRAETFEYDPQKHGLTFPAKTVIHYEFPAKDQRPAVKLTWYDGGLRPGKPDEMGADEKLPPTGGLVIGDQGKIVYGSHGAGKPEILPDARMEAFKNTQPHLARSPGHYQEWINACKTGGKTGSNFDYGGPLTEIALLGVIAIRFAGQCLEWDTKKMRFTNCPEANQFIKPHYRRGWKL